MASPSPVPRLSLPAQAPAAQPTLSPLARPATCPQPALPGASCEVVAHRGYRAVRDGVPGNTMPSFMYGLHKGAGDIEFDVRRLRDGTLVVHHDPAIGFKPLQYMKRADLPADGSVPLLDDVLRFARDNDLRMTVEMKEHGYEQEVLDRLDRYSPSNRYVVMSFEPDVVRAVKELRPDVTAGLLEYELPLTRTLRTIVRPAGPVARGRSVGADFIAVDKAMAGERLLRAASAAKMPVRVWTVDSETQLRRLLADDRVQAVITDHPDVANRVRAELATGQG